MCSLDFKRDRRRSGSFVGCHSNMDFQDSLAQGILLHKPFRFLNARFAVQIFELSEATKLLDKPRLSHQKPVSQCGILDLDDFADPFPHQCAHPFSHQFAHPFSHHNASLKRQLSFVLIYNQHPFLEHPNYHQRSRNLWLESTIFNALMNSSCPLCQALKRTNNSNEHHKVLHADLITSILHIRNGTCR